MDCPILNAIYDACVTHLRSQSKRVAMASLGAACEQWLNTELFIALNFADAPAVPEGTWARAEHNKIDLAIVQGVKHPMTVRAYIESKVVFPNGAHAEPIAKLTRQLQREAMDQVMNVPRVGFVFSCWSSYFRSDRNQFLQTIENTIRDTFAGTTAEVAAAVSITDGSTLRWQNDTVECDVFLHSVFFPQPRD